MDFLNEFLSRFWIPILLIILSIPLIFEKIPPNLFYGIRTKTTLSDNIIWYKVNKYGGWYFLISGILLFVYRLIDPYFEFLQTNYRGTVLIVLVIALIALMVRIRKNESK